MPGYEMALIMRILKRPDLIEGVKRTISAVIERGGVVKKFENLGEKRLPYRMTAHTEDFQRGHYFLVDFDAPPDSITSITEYLHRDIDVIRPSILNRETETQPAPPCPGPYSELYMPTNVRKGGKYRRDVNLDGLSEAPSPVHPRLKTV